MLKHCQERKTCAKYDIILDMTDAVIVRGEGGRFLAGTKSPAPITHANAREMQAKRAEKAALRARQRIVREAASIDPEVRDIYDAHALMLAKQYTTILDSDKPRMDDTRLLAQMLGTYAKDKDIAQGVTVPAPDSGDVVMLLLRRRLQADVVDGVVIPMRSDIEVDSE